MRRAGIDLGGTVFLSGLPITSRMPGSRIVIGNKVLLISNSRYTALGVNHPVILRTLTSHAELIIQDEVGISGGSICAAKKIVIGARTMIGANVMIVDNDFHPSESEDRRHSANSVETGAKEVVVEENVFVGANAIILKGVHIGKNSVIGAGSVVTRSIPADVVAVGNPCVVLRRLGEGDL